jgi:uncharacterized membrane protein
METSPVRSVSNPRRTYVALWALATALYVGLLVAGYVVAGVVAFAALALAAVAYHRRTDRALFDERDEAVLQEASANTVALLGQVSAVVFPATAALWALGYVAWPTWLTPVALFVAGLFVVWVGMILLARR